jgi:hypothetical protein
MKYVLKKNYSECLIYYNIRKIFIDIVNPKTESKYKLYEMYSNILISMLFLKCRFSKKTEKKIIDMLKKNRKLFSNYIHNNIINSS